MNRIFRIFVTLAAAAALLSCSKENFAGGDDFYDIRIEMNGSLAEEGRILGFTSCHLYIEGYEPGKSYFGALIDGKKDGCCKAVDSYFHLDITFQNINTARTGRKLDITHFNFANPLINGGNGFTSEYRGSVFLVERTEEEAVLFFEHLKCNILDTDFTFDGYVRCPVSESIPPSPVTHVFEYSPKSFELTVDAQRFEVNFAADHNFTVLLLPECEGWLKMVERTSEKYVFEISENEGKEARKTNILIHDDAKVLQGYEQITVRQAGRN